MSSCLAGRGNRADSRYRRMGVLLNRVRPGAAPGSECRCPAGSDGGQPFRQKQLQRGDFPGHGPPGILDETKLASKWLDLELTETALMDGVEKAPQTLQRLSTMGIRTSIDDFGTGYSSLNYLRQFNFQTLKMDRCFSCPEISTDRKAAAIVKSLISLAHNLDISVIAEGVETDAQLRMLAAERCDQVFKASSPQTGGSRSSVEFASRSVGVTGRNRDASTGVV